MLEFVIPCLLGLESLVGDEIRKLGLSDVRVENGRVLCRGEARDIARLNLNLRCGARVILVLHKFRATDFESLFQGVRADSSGASTGGSPGVGTSSLNSSSIVTP